MQRLFEFLSGKYGLKPIIDNIRRIKVIFVLLAVVAFFVSIVVLLPLLNKKYFSSWDEYNYASRSQKESAIATALNDFDSRLINNKSKMNVAFMLDADDVLPKLEKALNTSNFKDVFSKGIPILYYIFSPELLKTAPNSIREQALKFLIAFPKYEFSIGEELFRKYLKKHFQRERYKFWDLAFSENGNNNESKAEEINEMMWPFSRVLHDRELSANAWLDNDPDVSFNFALFKKLSVDEQAAVIKQALINLVVNKNGKLLDEKENKEIETFIETWSQKGSMLIYYYPLISYKDETEISEIVFAALKLISNELNNGLSGFNLDTFINKNDSNSEKSGESAQ